MIYPEITVTLTLDDIKLYDRAREIGLPSIVVSMYGDKIKKLLAEERTAERNVCAEQYLRIMNNAVIDAVDIEREACAKVCDENADDGSEGDWDVACVSCASKIRARG